jgi:outer membrane protein OmpA-like peptidoglycan-associated protein
MVNITPTNELDVDIKQCMFSIENLAWKDVNITGKGGYRFENGDFVVDYQNTLSEEQRGPNGGRIMWFPPYDIDFQETSSAEWHEDVFIGRGEPIYTYTNTRRNGSLSFTLLIDHPSVLDYWMLDKKRGENDINDEQTLLRYFAGCETIAPSEDVTDKILRGEYSGGSKNITPNFSNEDIVFNTYFPNNYSGVDEEGGAEGALEMLFGGQYLNDSLYTGDTGTLEAFADSGETLFLGYEMGLNPISTAFFNDGTTIVDKTLVEVMNKKKADEKYKDQEFTEVANDKITKDKFLSEGYIYINYNRKEKNTSKEKLEGEKREYSTKKTELETLVNGMKIELKNMKEELSHLSSGTVEYELLTKDIEEKDREIFKNNYEINVYKSLIEGVDLALGLSNEDVQLCKEIFGEINTNPFIKTQPIYCFYSKDNSGETISEKIEYNIGAKTAYAKYLLEKVNEYDNINDYYQKGLNELVCRVKKGKKKDDGYDYYAAAVSKASGDIVFDEYNTFQNKREFSKSAWPFGRVTTEKGNTKYYYKNQKDNIKESDKKETRVSILIDEEVVIIYPNEQAFKDSGAICGFLDDENKYVYYEAQKLSSKEEALQKIIDSFTDEDIEKAYEKHMYGSSNEIQSDIDYWGIQYYCVYEKPVSDEENTDTAGNYKTKQEFTVNGKIPGSATASTEWVGEGTILTEGGDTFNLSSMLKFDSNKDNKNYCYPHDESTKSENLIAYNYADLASFGLNSTYEIIKEQDNSVTCSFGEFYAAYKEGTSGGTYTNFVLACEEAILRSEKKFTGDTLTEKIEEAKARIQYVAQCLGKHKSKITKISVLGDASSDGDMNKNNTLAKNRSKTLYDFLQTLGVGNILNNETEKASEKSERPNESNISDLVAKKDRRTKTKIIIGNEDIEKGKGYENERIDPTASTVTFKNEQYQYRRYDDERLFFSMLKEEDNIAYTNLIKKVRYFSPAFHSITPEGFNARLTFLQQCTRQGPTITASKVGTSGSTAANLAFGRAPFCVLRLGDFLNTRIVVKSVNITYPDNMWDLNHDGIGAQFMMAKVSMQIEIIGGSDISAPIKRLQNAVSFNYYANTSIYDNRSDIAQYNGNGTSSDVRTWNPSLKPRQNS